MKIKPFKAIRPVSCEVDKIASLPYDVVEEEEARLLGDENEKSFLHIDRAEIDLPGYVGESDSQVFEQAKLNLQSFLNNEWLQQDKKPLYYLYRLRKEGKALYGIAMTVSLEEYRKGRIKRHEQTIPDKESERFYHSVACDANLSPITLVYPEHERLEKLILQFKDRKLPTYAFDSFYDVEHYVWVIDDELLAEQITDIFAEEIERMYLLDGHHRIEAAAQFSQQQKELWSDGDELESDYVLAVAFPMSQVEIQPYHRIVRGRLHAPEWRKIKENFIVEEVPESAFQPQAAGSIGMYDGESFFQLTVKANRLEKDSPCRADVDLLQELILQPAFGITDPITDKRLTFFGGGLGVEALVARSEEKKHSVAFALFPTSKDQLLRAADSGETLPPYSTWFEPKVLSGIFIHAFETKVPSPLEQKVTF